MITLKLTPQQYDIILTALKKADEYAKTKDSRLSYSSFEDTYKEICLDYKS